ncbi:MAG: hypothetical protein Q4D79_11190 [Propionibacteriaceae bacterium]|nr:hypothetical protein [Propionibacteriaceae bacterium]
MSAVRAELRKAAGSAPIRWALLLGMLLPPLLAWFNGSGIRAEMDAGIIERDLEVIGSGELLLAGAAAAVIGVVLIGAEYVAMPNELGGGRQATTTALATPSRLRALGAKLAVAVGLLGLLGGVSAFGSLLVAQRALGSHALPLDAERSGQGTAGMGYVVLYGLLAFAVTALVRRGLVPLIYLVANQTVISVGYLLTLRWRWAWYLPDTSAMAIMRTPADPGQPPAAIGLTVGIAWVVGLLVLAAVLNERREA